MPGCSAPWSFLTTGSPSAEAMTRLEPPPLDWPVLRAQAGDRDAVELLLLGSDT